MKDFGVRLGVFRAEVAEDVLMLNRFVMNTLRQYLAKVCRNSLVFYETKILFWLFYVQLMNNLYNLVIFRHHILVFFACFNA
jgi:hypothetical protein